MFENLHTADERETIAGLYDEASPLPELLAIVFDARLRATAFGG